MEVPKDIMMSAYDFTEGWASATGAKQINLLTVSYTHLDVYKRQLCDLFQTVVNGNTQNTWINFIMKLIWSIGIAQAYEFGFRNGKEN